MSHSADELQSRSPNLAVRLLIILAAALSVELSAPPTALTTVHAQSVSGLEQRDLDGDGVPDLTIVHCACATASDLVYVYDGDGDMRIASAVSEATDFSNDSWIFDIGSDGTAQLIIRFTTEAGELAALLYDDQSGDGHVAFDAEGGKVRILESESWSLRVVSEAGWVLPNGFPSQNLRFYFGESEDVVAGIVDIGRDTIPDYEFWGVSTESVNHPAAEPGLWVNRGTERPAVAGETCFWPFLITGGRPKAQGKFTLTPFIVVDWERGVIQGTSIGKVASGYPAEEGYFILPVAPLRLNASNYVNFENPMAYYDLAEDQDGLPELHVRMTYYGPSDPYLDAGPSSRALNDIRYSWNQDNSSDTVWDYKVGLAGDHVVDSEVGFADFGIKTIPYETLPSWVGEQTWAWGTLVTNEGGGSPTSEGIYEWSAADAFWPDAASLETIVPGSQIEIREYLLGQTTAPADRFFSDIRPGMRGEFGYLDDRPYLYFSPVDARLHLRRAMKGTWNLGDDREISYVDLDHDSYLDQWQYFEDGLPHRQLNILLNQLIYSDPISKTVQLKRADVVSALFEMLPPQNHAEWLALGEQLAKYRRDFEPSDLASMSAHFAGPTTEIQHATLHELRTTPQGFRFILELEPGFHASYDQENLMPLLGAPGSYVVEYDGNAWSARRATPAALRLDGLQISSDAEGFQAHRWTTVTATLRNEGLEDVRALPLCATFEDASGNQVVMTDTVALLPGEGERRVAWKWAPPAPGTWNVRLAANCSGTEEDAPSLLPLGETVVEVVAGASPMAGWLVSLGGLVPGSVPLFLLAAVALAGLAAAAWAKGSHE